jgi:hypothetical protein
MIEADIQDTESFHHRSPTIKGKGRFLTTMRQLVDFERFLAQYWLHFPQRLTKKFGPLTALNSCLLIDKNSRPSPCFQWNPGFEYLRFYSEIL